MAEPRKRGMIAEIRKKRLKVVVEKHTAMDMESVEAVVAKRKELSRQRLTKAFRAKRGKRNHF